jgi:hypothetical protein
MQQKPTVKLAPRVVRGEDNEKKTEEREPGESENITLNWPPYFPNTWTDTKQAIEAIQAARGGGSAIISRKTATENAAPMLGIADVDQELEAIDEDRATDVAFMQNAMGEAGEGGSSSEAGAGGEDEGHEPGEE